MGNKICHSISLCCSYNYITDTWSKISTSFKYCFMLIIILVELPLLLVEICIIINVIRNIYFYVKILIEIIITSNNMGSYNHIRYYYAYQCNGYPVYCNLWYTIL